MKLLEGLRYAFDSVPKTNVKGILKRAERK